MTILLERTSSTIEKIVLLFGNVATVETLAVEFNQRKYEKCVPLSLSPASSMIKTYRKARRSLTNFAVTSGVSLFVVTVDLVQRKGIYAGIWARALKVGIAISFELTHLPHESLLNHEDTNFFLSIGTKALLNHIKQLCAWLTNDNVNIIQQLEAQE